jgi:hypothetical protein
LLIGILAIEFTCVLATVTDACVLALCTLIKEVDRRTKARHVAGLLGRTILPLQSFAPLAIFLSKQSVSALPLSSVRTNGLLNNTGAGRDNGGQLSH